MAPAPTSPRRRRFAAELYEPEKHSGIHYHVKGTYNAGQPPQEKPDTLHRKKNPQPENPDNLHKKIARQDYIASPTDSIARQAGGRSGRQEPTGTRRQKASKIWAAQNASSLLLSLL